MTNRTARAFANSQPPPNPDPNDPDPYQQTYGYNAFNHMTSRNNTFWNQPLNMYTGTYVNDRQQSWNYDAAGNVKDDSEGNHYTFNTASQMTYWNSSSNGTIAQTYDGDGQAGYRQESHYNPYQQTTYTSTRYYLRSSVLGGQIIAEVNESGQRRKRHVYGTGGEIGRETYQTYSQQYVAGLVFRNPITGDSTDGATDPLGGLMPPEDAYATNPNPDYFGMLGDRDSHSADADPFEPSGGCTLDGIPINCDVAIGLANHGGAAVAPLKRVQAVTYQGRSVLAYWNAYGDGYEGFVPLSARYVGGGQFRPYGAPGLLGRGTTARSDTDFRELNGVSDADPEAQLARSIGVGFGISSGNFPERFLIGRFKFSEQEMARLNKAFERIAARKCVDFFNEAVRQAIASGIIQRDPARPTTLEGVLNTTTLNKYSASLTAKDVGLSESYWNGIRNVFADDAKFARAVTSRYDGRIFLHDRSFYQASVLAGLFRGMKNTDLSGTIIHEFFHRVGFEHGPDFPRANDIQKNCGIPGFGMGSSDRQ